MNTRTWLSLTFLVLILPHVDSATAQGRLEVATPVLNFGTYPAWEQRMAQFQLRNTGKSDLTIHAVRSSCGCAVAKLDKKQVAPKEEIQLSVSVLPNSIFKNYRKSIYIRSSDPSQPLLKLEVKGNAVPLVDIAPDRYISAGILKLHEPQEWIFTLNTTRSPVRFAALTTTSSIPVSIDFQEAITPETSRTIRVKMPAQQYPTRLDMSATTQATYGTNTMPITVSINALIGTHLVAIPSEITVLPESSSHRANVRLHLVAPRHTSASLTCDTLTMPTVEGVTFQDPRPDHTGKGLIVGLTFSPEFGMRLQEEKGIPLIFSAGDSAAATVLLKAPIAN